MIRFDIKTEKRGQRDNVTRPPNFDVVREYRFRHHIAQLV